MVVALAVVETSGIPVGAVEAVQQRIVARAAGGAAGTADGAVAGAVATDVIGLLAPGGAGGDGDLARPIGDGGAVDRKVKCVLHLMGNLYRARTPIVAAINPVLLGLADRRAKGIERYAAFRSGDFAAAGDGAKRGVRVPGLVGR